jgi:WD40 repeat protein
MAERFPESQLKRRQAQRLADIAANLPHIMSFLPLSMCSAIPQVSTYWNYGACQHLEFVDMRNCVPWQAYRAHGGQVDSILIHNTFVYSGGDRRVLTSNFETAEVTSTITRDSGSITFLYEKEQELFICSSNGAIRTYGLTHTGRNIKPITTMWEHSKPLLHVLQSLPSTGLCSMHGIENHVCTLYTCSTDRTIFQWDISKHTPVRCIESRAMRSATFMRLAQSDRHIFAGTSAATVAVFCKLSKCERDDIHTCNIPGANQSYCLQLSLKLPPITLKSGNPAAVTGLICVDVSFPFSHLWAADSSGQLTVWHVPESGLGFIPAHTVKAHDGPINNLVHTHKHAISISDDGYVVLMDLTTFDRIRAVNVVEWASLCGLLERPDIGRKIKCVSLQEDHEYGGMMAVGTSYGDIIMLRLGTTV